MACRVGLEIGRHQVRAVVVDGGQVAWFGAETIADADDIAAAVERLLRSMPSVRVSRRITAAVAPSACQVKTLAGVPDTREARVIAAVVATNASRFFLSTTTGLATVVAPRVGGGWWAAAFDEGVIREASAGCRAAAFALVACVPAIVAAGHAVGSGSFSILDGHCHVASSFDGGRLVATGRGSDPDVEQSANPIPALRAIGDAWPSFAAAYSVAATRPSFLALRLSTAERQSARTLLRLSSSIAAGASLCAMLLAPGMSAVRARARADAQLDHSRESVTAAESADAELRAEDAALGEIARFQSSRRPMLLLLGHVSATLPDSTAVVSLRADSAGGSMVVLSPVGSTPLAQLDSVPEVKGAQIVGAITRESIGGALLQRQSIRFRLARATASPAQRGGR